MDHSAFARWPYSIHPPIIAGWSSQELPVKRPCPQSLTLHDEIRVQLVDVIKRQDGLHGLKNFVQFVYGGHNSLSGSGGLSTVFGVVANWPEHVVKYIFVVVRQKTDIHHQHRQYNYQVGYKVHNVRIRVA